ncbi:MAG TPA: tRNA pseudouridine(55) synthase TruB [Thermoanaerobaculia bacterium]|nr:tRNA pseudouridine(55) synthase TruB [Thermoanaerobaculia bacterium]
MSRAEGLHGLLLVDKPPGCTSHDVVRDARRALRERKIGHCGTLDPDATGLLLLTVGRATRLTRFLIRAPKVYEGIIRFGVVTDTYDASGQVIGEHSIAGLDAAAVAARMSELVGTYPQLPPPYCAKKTGGRKFYELARKGEEVPREPVEVQIYDFRTIRDGLDGGDLPFRLACASGTYARSLAHDLGERLGCGAHLAALRRTAIGHFSIDSAAPMATLESCEGDTGRLDQAWIPFDRIPLPFPEVQADANQERRVLNGQSALLQGLEADEGDWIKLVNPRRRFIAVGSVVERIGDRGVGVVQPRIVFK